MPRGYSNKLVKRLRSAAEKLDLARMASELGKRGAKARNKRLSAERRQEIARNAARERWRRVAQVNAPSSDETPTDNPSM